jgi:hypothetical protein
MNFVVKLDSDYYESDIEEASEPSLDPPFGSGNFKLTYAIQTFDEMRGDFEAGMDGVSPGSGDTVTATSHDFDTYAPKPEIPEVNISLTSKMLAAVSRKLKATFTPEVQ